MYFDLDELEKPEEAKPVIKKQEGISHILTDRPPPIIKVVKTVPTQKTYVRPFGYVIIPKDPFLNFLLKYNPDQFEITSTDTEIKFIITDEIFKKALYNENIVELYSHYIDIIPHNKHKYILPPYTYKKFMTFTRDICAQLDWKYTYFIKRIIGTYKIYYDIYIPSRIIRNLLKSQSKIM
jgi:hypothetical protein